MSELGDFLSLARKRKGLTQRELASRVNCVHTYIDKIEKGKQRGSYNILLKIAAALDLPPNLVLARAGFMVAEQRSKYDLGLEDHQFAKLSGVIKRLLLEISPILEKYLVS